MFIYLVRRMILLIPTFLGITLVTFLLINLAPGGPVEQKLQAMRFAGAMGGGDGGGGRDSAVSEEVVEALKKQYGFDKPVHVRYFIWLRNLVHLDFGNSFTYEEPVIDVIASKFPVSLQFGIASLFLTYIVCIPLGVKKARQAGGAFDQVSGLILYFAYSIPPLVLGIFLIVFLAGSSYLNWFPIGGFQSDDYESFTLMGKIGDRVWHFVLPLCCYVIGSFTELTMLMRNSMLDVIKSDYVRTARAKGLSENKVIFKHALRNALIPIATGLSGFFALFLAGSLIIEQIFNLDGIGLLSYQSILSRDYNVIMGLTFISSMILLFGRIFSDVVYVLIDPRIDFK
ncbi:MAG: ABC transporter permease subunit [Bdellovibrionaceae bacterium]|nr:ABC transporter permease subunit [Pseudobdellovibrionaceae bacterium]MBX3032663.1 ABC transporter permease subunit [Pseudobdellovibrionaceae bacterium]